MHPEDLDEDQKYWSSDDEVPGVDSQLHRICNTKYRSKQPVPMDAILAKSIVSMSKGQGVKIQALADSGSSACIISLELAIKLGLEREDPGDTKLSDASGARMDVTGVATVAVRELAGIPSCFHVLVSKDIGKEKLVIGIDEQSLHEGGGKLFSRVVLKLDKSGVYGYTEQ